MANDAHKVDFYEKAAAKGAQLEPFKIIMKNLEGQRTIAYEDENSFQQHLSVALADACGG